MPKLKTNKAAKKRLRITKNKKILRSKAKRRHILTDKSANTKRGLRKKTLVSATEKSKVLKLMPYG